MNRKDVWTDEQDQFLANEVLNRIKTGGTQLEAFEFVGKKLIRTPAACGFRWNSEVRKKYEDEIKIAKSERKKIKSNATNTTKLAAISEQSDTKQIGNTPFTNNIVQETKVSIDVTLQELTTQIQQIQDENKALYERINVLNERNKHLTELLLAFKTAADKSEILNEYLNDKKTAI